MTIGSQIVLPELEFFRAQWVADRDVDIAVRVGDVGGRKPSKRAAMTEYAHPAAVRYTEHLGRIGANFRVYMGSPLSVEIGPLLAQVSDAERTLAFDVAQQFVNVLLARAKLPPDSVAIIGVGATAGAVAIMKRGEIDAISNLDPVISQLESDGAIVPVVDTRTAKGMQDVYGSAYAAGCIYVPVEFSKKYPNTAQAIVNAMVHALRFIQQSTLDQIVAAVPTDYYTDKAQYKAALEKNIETYKHDGSIGLDAAQAVYRDLKSFDPQVQTATVDVAKSFNMTFQQKAAQKYR